MEKLFNSEMADITPTITPTMTAIPVPTPIVLMNHEEKPEKFNGTDSKRWQQKMLFYLTTLNLTKFLCEDVPDGDCGNSHDPAIVYTQNTKNSD